MRRGSNVGQVANQAAVKLDQEGIGKLFCLAGLGGHVQSIVESTKAAKRIVAIDDFAWTDEEIERVVKVVKESLRY
ncbi:MAG: hypothetical protein PWP65_1125 [Clostridia bacterium]|nr:hypothetical protein [Clostridia bacterium]